jgi:hypothetical protein
MPRADGQGVMNGRQPSGQIRCRKPTILMEHLTGDRNLIGRRLAHDRNDEGSQFRPRQ